MYDVSEPASPVSADCLITRNFSGYPSEGAAGALGPEGIAFIAPWQSPTQKAILVVAHEISGTTTILEID